MTNNIEQVFAKLISSITNIDEVLSAGRSGGRPLPQSPADGDIDVFLYCSAIPSESTRRAVLESLGSTLENFRIGAFAGGHWGVGDCVSICGVEVWLMYFTVDEAMSEVEAVLRGDLPDKLDNYYYPVGRCAMLAGIGILCDKTGFLSSLKARLSVYPEELSGCLAAYHLGKLRNTEDLERAVSRRDVLFYHFALDVALDHFLQALFAVNRVFFPSRKRSLDHISGFGKNPADCENRLLAVVRFGGEPETIAQSYENFMKLTGELKELA